MGVCDVSERGFMYTRMVGQMAVNTWLKRDEMKDFLALNNHI
jgi:hypothetical protein